MYEEENVVAQEEVFEDETLVCKECGNEFVFTAGEKQFYKEKGFVNKPKCCKPCRDARKNAERAPRELIEIVCAGCGATTKVTSDRHTYCKACFDARRNG